MRVPRALEFPAVIAVTMVLTFTGVSALQACVNPPLAHMAEERVAAGIQAVVDIEEESGTDDASAMRDIFIRDAVVPASLTPRGTSPQEAAALATTGADIVLAPATEGQPIGGAVQPEGSIGAEQAQAVARPPAAAQSETAAGQGVSANVPSVASPQAQQHAATPAKPAPVSGMDFVWDQVFGSGSYAKPAAPARPAEPPAGAKSQGAKNAAVCPPGQAKKDKC